MSLNRVTCCLKANPKRLINHVINTQKQFSSFKPLLIESKPLKRFYPPLINLYSTHITDVTGDKSEKTTPLSLIQKILNKVPFISVEKSRLSVLGYLLYESIADKIVYVDFFEEFNLPDTFYSWFVITELHVWMLMVRCMAEGDNGRFVRNHIVEAMWADVGQRVKKIGAVNPSATRAQVKELSEQFQAALIAYDEGLQSDDCVLAGAIWRRMYQRNEVDPENLELLIKYIRKHLRMLDNISKEELFSQKPISWELLHK
ncbi:ubiquinol-cytochrome-c reductase complex assembly factor 1 [Onthophagus taurus]|uniref:ubiquinol-cytochrome-c reductase complex assembly factor 1 n=1 Tax=Onthophagus taurus TaxID=166361 RepID=UPI000C206ECE|nr:ubiquinol-cytochrome-c reductase complex assembly factor 1 [Onthophagus taurus]